MAWQDAQEQRRAEECRCGAWAGGPYTTRAILQRHVRDAQRALRRNQQNFGAWTDRAASFGAVKRY
eukprot:2662696-Lingulodinium_polyedra.AAC.1